MRRHTAAPLTIALLIFGCACFSIASFDPVVATGAGELQQKCEVFLSGLADCAGTPEAAYEHHTAFYAEARQELARLTKEAGRQSGNELTLRALESIGDNLDELEGLHRAGISREEIGVIAGIFDTQFRMLVELENAKTRKEE